MIRYVAVRGQLLDAVLHLRRRGPAAARACVEDNPAARPGSRERDAPARPAVPAPARRAMRRRRTPIPPAVAFDALAAGWDRAHGPRSGRARELADRVDYLRDLCHRRRVARALELGCGTGTHLLALADTLEQGTGIDIAPAMIGHARCNAASVPNLRFLTADATQLTATAAGGRFDVVLFVGALEHMGAARTALARAAAMMRHHGRVIVIMPHPWRAGVRCNGTPRLHGRPIRTRHLSPRRLDRAARHAGLRLERLTGLGPPAPRRGHGACGGPRRRRLPTGIAGSPRAARHHVYAAELRCAGRGMPGA